MWAVGPFNLLSVSALHAEHLILYARVRGVPALKPKRPIYVNGPFKRTRVRYGRLNRDDLTIDTTIPLSSILASLRCWVQGNYPLLMRL